MKSLTVRIEELEARVTQQQELINHMIKTMSNLSEAVCRNTKAIIMTTDHCLAKKDEHEV